MSSDFKSRSRSIARDAYWERHDRLTYNCPDCGRSEGEIEGSFEVHHKNGHALDNRPENHVALCRLCHNLREGKKPSIAAVKRLREQKGGMTNQTVGKGLLHVRELFHCSYSKVESLPEGEQIPGLFEEYHGTTRTPWEEITETEVQSRRDCLMYLKGKGDLFSYYLDNLDELVDRADIRCERCGADLDTPHHMWEGGDLEEYEDWYYLYPAKWGTYCIHCDPYLPADFNPRESDEQ